MRGIGRGRVAMDGEDRESLDGTGDSGHEPDWDVDWDVERPGNETYVVNDGVRCGAWAEAGQHLTRICQQRTGVRPDTAVTPVRAPDFNTPSRLLLQNALDGGVISAEHHDEQVRQQRGDGGRILKAPNIRPATAR